MAFQSGITAAQQTILSVCSILLTDTSNYDAANNPPDPAHARINFDKKRIVVTNQDGIQYTMDSIEVPPAVDESIDPPSSGAPADVNTYSFNGNDTNGTYLVELFSVPNWEQGELYDLSVNHIVYFSGVFYRTTIENNGNAPDSLIGWTVVDYDYLRTTTKYFDSTTVVVNCLTTESFQESLLEPTDRVYDVEVNETCDALTIIDHSNYATNTDGGHNITDFSEYRTLIISRPKSGDYIMSSVSAIEPDEAISAPSSGNNTFTYNFTELDEDGLYTISICAFPSWRDTATYALNSRQTIVYYNGVLYKILQANTDQQPDTATDYWEIFVPNGTDEYVTRYCYIAKVAVKCISLSRCRERLTHEAFCLMNSDFCNDDVLCKNKKFLQLQKLRTLDDAMIYSMNRQAWTEVEAQFNLMRTICNC